jgi:hypothetical protein
VCDEELDQCVSTPINIGTMCSDPLFCLNGRAMECSELGLCEDPNPEAGTPCEGETGNQCTGYVCDEAAEDCVETPVANGTACNDGNPCTGDNQCQNGLCARGPDLPCDDFDPCTTDPCTDNGGIAACGTPVDIADGEPCQDTYRCFGSDPVCMSGECIATEDMCADDQGICTINACFEQYYDWVECEETVSNPGYLVSCGETVTVDDSPTVVFPTREYFAYNEDCPGDFPGKEAAIVVYTENPGDLTISVSAVSPAMDIAILELGDWCSAATCIQAANNTLTFTAAPGGNPIVFEAMSDLPPTSFDVTVSACP